MASPFGLAKSASDAAGKLIVRSALNPLLWFSAILSPTFFWMAIYVRADDRYLMWGLFAAGVLPILVTCGIAFVFALYKTDKLQSEDYQIRQQSLQLLQDRTGAQVLDAVTVIANPALPATVGDGATRTES